jgi:CysZ protein
MIFKSIYQGFSAFFKGIQLCIKKKYISLTAVPLLINMVGFVAALYFVYDQTLTAIEALDAWLPETLVWLKWFILPLVVMGTYLVVQFCFLFVLNLISAPFNSLLAERVYCDLQTAASQETLPESPWLQVVKSSLARQGQKLKYSLPKLLICFAFSLIPFVGQFLAPVLACIVGGWLLAIEYLDFHMEHQNRSFAETLRLAKDSKVSTLSYGIALLIAALLPIMNFILMPAAVCGAAYLIHNAPAKINLKES